MQIKYRGGFRVGKKINDTASQAIKTVEHVVDKAKKTLSGLWTKTATVGLT